MASDKDQLVCHVCGFKNDATAERCVSCGAKLEELSGVYTAEEEDKKKGLQDGFDLKWAGIAVAVYLVLQATALWLLPMAIDAYDPQGGEALAVSVGVWLIGGLIVGLISPGKTFLEPAAGALIAVVPTIWWLVQTTPSGPEHLGGGFSLNMPTYIAGALAGGVISVFGAFLGEKIQDLMGGGKKKKKKR